MRALLAPGQGAQRSGMLLPWLADPAAADRLERWSDITGLDLRLLGTTADEAAIRETHVAQPLLVATALLALRRWLPTTEAVHAACGLVAGHSVGEFVAAAAAGVLTDDDAMRLVAIRGRAMSRACAPVGATGMTAILGGEDVAVAAAISAAGAVVATVNARGQVVAAGSAAALATLAANPPAGARLVALPVAGAFHTATMAAAVSDLRTAFDDITPGPVRVPMVLNRDGQITSDPGEVIAEMITQVAAPVRWDLCQAQIAASGVTEVIELPPSGTLTALARREMPTAARVPVNTPADLPGAES